MKKIINFSFLLIFQILFSQNNQQFVNPFIGTGGHGHTFPGATLPFGMVQLSPDTRIDGSWDGCSGYHYSDSVIYGFSHTHLNGTGVSDFGDILLMPTMGEVSFDNKEYSSAFSHDNEKASAGFYSVKLDKHNIDVQLTTSTRVGMHQYTFNKSGLANIIIDLNHRDKLLYGDIKIINSRTIQILRRSEAWATNQYVYAQIELNVPMEISKVVANQETKKNFYSGTELKIAFSKQVKSGEKIIVKVALSPTSYEGAKLNSSEISGWDFEKVKKLAQESWNLELSKIQITETDNDKLSIFYTALYHTMMQPNIAQDIDGKYRGRDTKIHESDRFDYYSVFSLWDTFRAAHPLYTLIDKKRTADFINTFLKQYEQAGRLPVWELASNETDCMIGYHSVSVMADAMAKGITGFDYNKAFEAAKHSAMRDELGLKAYKENGFISIDDDHESVSKTLEYAYDDWCIAQMAKILNLKEDFNYFMNRSQNWKNLFDYKSGFIRPKKNGGWEKSFDPREVNNNYTEGNAWQYTFFVPQDIPGMIEAFGGNENFEAKLDEMFNSESKTTGREQVDVTGLIGQYAHGNEPSHHMAYLYNYVNKPEKTTEKVHFILDNFYKNAPDGLIGNEDCGQMSAWYVLSSMGIYAVTPGIPKWEIIKPYFKNVNIKVGDTNELTNIDKFDKKRIGVYRTNHDLMTLQPKFSDIIPVPVFEAKSKAFTENLKVEFTSQNPSDKIYYWMNGINDSTKDKIWKLYTQPLLINATIEILAKINNDGKESAIVKANYFKKPNNYTIQIKGKFNSQYNAGGDSGLLDGIYGNENWRKGEWQGYQNQDFEAIIDLQEVKAISEITSNYLQDTRSWILMPTKVDYYISENNINFTKIGTVENTIDPKNYETVIKQFPIQFKKQKVRYVKVVATNFGKLPSWHQGYPDSGDAFIFIDEIEIK
jgi:predicted alpha-1,2-mannosidase